jgi:sterol desaturase/sphingolipid hydroxylase (fatty acid hydroxylase superfamily)
MVWLAVGTAATIASAFVGNEALLGIPILFAISWPLERIWRRHPVPVRRIGLRTDLAYAAAQVPLQVIGLAVAVVVAIVSLGWLPGLLLRPLVTALPFWVQVVAGILAFDVLIYWGHRWMHTVPLLWRFHSIHHSTIHLDWVSGFRNHPFDGVFLAPAAAFLIGAGLDNRFVGALAVLQFVTGLWAHLNVRWRLRPLRAVVLTPDFHHWHHANEPEAINKNFSVFLPIWDIAFGSYYMPADKRPQRYGVNDPVPPDITGQLLYPFHGVRAAIGRRRSLRRAARS